MKRIALLVMVFGLVLATGFGAGHWYAGREFSPARAGVSLGAVAQPDALADHSAEFSPEVVAVAPGIWVAVGYGLANAILIEGDDGLLLIDTMETLEEGRLVAGLFAQLSSKPLKAIIYTHNHADHVFGARAFADVLGAGDDLKIFAHRSTSDRIDRIMSVYRPIITRRSLRMFGVFLDEAGLINAGIGPRLGMSADSTLGLIRPNEPVDDRLSTRIAGIQIELMHAPGESDDQLLVWLPERGALAPGDNIYRTFPNLYTIRGTPYRDPTKWVASLDLMRALEPSVLLPSHTRPVTGREQINRILTDYRDAIQFVHDQTVRHINQGLTPDQIVERIRLPDHLAASPYLKEFYGTVRWSVRSVFGGNLGWFDGNPTHLRPHAPAERAQRWSALAGGAGKLQANARQALADGDPQWALRLTDHLIALDSSDQSAIDLRIDALKRLGGSDANPNARHYYLTRAAELAGQLEIPSQLARPDDAMLRELPLPRFFQAMAANLQSERALEMDQSVSFEFSDLDQWYTIRVRRGVAEVVPGVAVDAALRVRVDSLVFKQLLAGWRNPAVTLATEFEIEGQVLDLAAFLSLFEPRRMRGAL